MKDQLRGSLYLLLATIIWGSAFVAQSVGMDHIGPFTFQAVRCLLAVAALVPVIALMDNRKASNASWKDPRLWKIGLLCGIALFVASGLQQVGLIYTDPGKAGFITAMYIVLVPVLGLFLKEKIGTRIWISVALAVVGLYLLSCVGVNSINIGDVYILGAAAAFAVQITLIDRLGQALDGLRLNCVQFIVNGVLSALMMCLTETPRMADITACAVPLLYTGVLSSAVAYSLQIMGQQHLSSDKASLIMSLESVFAVLSGWLLLNQTMSFVELLGCCLVFAAVILSQLPVQRKNNTAAKRCGNAEP